MNLEQGVNFPLNDLKAIVSGLRQDHPEIMAEGEIWNDAAITGTFSFSAGGATLDAWITLYDGTKFHVELASVTSKIGTAAGAFALPLIRVKPLVSGELGTFELGGFWAGGSLSLSPVDKSFPVISAAPLNYYLSGTAKFT